IGPRHGVQAQAEALGRQVRHERAAPSVRLVCESRRGPDLRQRLDPSTGTRLHLIEPAAQVVVTARAPGDAEERGRANDDFLEGDALHRHHPAESSSRYRYVFAVTSSVSSSYAFCAAGVITMSCNVTI